MATRINTGFDERTVAEIDAWAKEHGLDNRAQAVRALTIYALSEPRDRAFRAAFEQALADLRQTIGTVLRETMDVVTKRILRGV